MNNYFELKISINPEIEEIVSDFKEKGLIVPTFHADKFIGQKIGVGGEENTREAFSQFRKNCDMASKLGAKKVILHLWNGPGIWSVKCCVE